MRKYGLYLLIAVGLLAGCQKKYTAMDTTTAQTSAEETKTTESAKVTVEEESKAAGETDTKETESTGKLDPIPIAVTGEYDGEWTARLRSSRPGVTGPLSRETDMRR